MTSAWLLLAILAQVLAAAVVLVDKFVLKTKQGIASPAAYAFATASLSAFAIVLVPLGLVPVPSLAVLIYSVLAGGAYLLSLVSLYSALSRMSATAVAPITTAATAVSTALLASLFLASDLPASFVLSFLLLVVGTVLIYCFCFSWRTLALVVLSGLLAGTSTFLVKLVATATDLGGALFWPLMGNVCAALLLLLVPGVFKNVQGAFAESSSGAKWLVLVSRALGGLSFLFSLSAIAMGSASIVAALGGLSLVFVLAAAAILARLRPHEFSGEAHTGTSGWLALLGTLLVSLGLALLVLT